MKKSLLLLAALAPALMSQAEGTVHVYDFNTHGVFAAFQNPDDLFMFQGETPGNYDFVDKYGKTVNTDGEMLTYYELDENETKIWHAVTNRVISLEDGLTYMLREPDDSNTALANEDPEICGLAAENGVIPADHVFLGWDEDGIGPARTLWMPGWGTLDEWTDVNYNTALAEDWVSTKHGFQMSRQGNNASRKQTYIQFPEMQAPLKITMWVGTPLGKYATELNVKVAPVVNGVEGDAIIVSDPDVVAKRFYKKEVILDGEGPMAVRLGCNGHELYFSHITIEENAEGGISDVMVDTQATDAPAYNLLGQPVDDSYRGFVVKDGKKYFRK